MSLGHDILHGVFHFEGKVWRTLPELFFHPGRLTRRYVDGERAKFVSPMALFLFVVFLMFAVFSFTGGALVGDTGGRTLITANWQSSEIENADRKLAALRTQRANPDLSPSQRVDLDGKIAELESARAVMVALGSGDFARLAELERANEKKTAD